MLKRLDQPQLPLPKVSDHEPLKFQFERLTSVAPEVAALAVDHYNSLPEELKQWPLEVDWERCFGADLHGFIHAMTVRNQDGKLVGYVINQVMRPFMYAGTKWAFIEAIYLAEEYREGWTGYQMLKKNTESMKKIGCNVIKCFVPQGTFEPLLKRLGYTPLEVGYFKNL